jgi:cell division protein FtsB
MCFISARILPYMIHFGQKKSFITLLYSRPMLVVLSIIVLFLSISVHERYTVAREMSQRRISEQKEKDALVERKHMLEEKVEYLTGERGLEEEIRTSFDVAKEGEKVIILMGEKPEAPEAVPIPTAPEPWYKFW